MIPPVKQCLFCNLIFHKKKQHFVKDDAKSITGSHRFKHKVGTHKATSLLPSNLPPSLLKIFASVKNTHIIVITLRLNL